MSLRDGQNKMSKSDASDYSRINMTDDSDTIALKIRKARTDPDALPGTPDGLKERPEAANLVGIYAALEGTTAEAVCAKYEGRMFSAFKPDLADLAVSVLAPIAAEMTRLMDDPGHIDGILAAGAERATATAHKTMAEVHGIMGLGPAADL
jgi:tryptophanyl-tRNA synthetase